jgi:lipopolysaccharide/colanic/teichoic acid biosynthesis glycosyltransferase/ADP-glucose pyrophosphorylase
MHRAPSTAVILAGGLATFSGAVIAPVPKILLPVCNCPLYQYLAQVLSLAGVRDLIICVQEDLEAQVAGYLSLSPPPLNYHIRKTASGTGGSLKEVEPDIKGDAFWVLNGDLLLQTDLSLMWEFHRQHRAMATVGAVKICEAPGKAGRVELGKDGNLKAIHPVQPFQEKRSKLRPAGIYLFESGVLELIPPQSYFDLKEELFPVLYHLQATTKAWEIPGYCRTLTRLDDLFSINRDVLMKRVSFEGVKGLEEDSMASNPVTRIDPTSSLVPPFKIGAGSRIDAGVLILGPTVIGPKCEVQAGAVVNNCVILGKAQIGRLARLDHCLVGEGAVIGEGATLRDQSVTAPSNPSGGRKSRGVAFGQADWQVHVSRFYLAAKRAIDVVASAIILVLLSPVLLAVALAVKLDSPGPIFFRQIRCGLRGKEFTMYKFRSMVANAEDLKRKLQAFNEVDGPMFKIMEDPRITRVGKFLRDTNLDEIPQLWNVLKGEMSLVGPRPLCMEEMAHNPKWRDCRLAVRPGVTGLWQAKAHDKIFFNDWIRYDMEYVNKCSLWFDLKIVMLTLFKEMNFFRRKKKNNGMMDSNNPDCAAEGSPK